jgi:hypothetical protein
MDVRTPSRFKSNEDDAAEDVMSPVIKKTGPSTPPKRVAPISQIKSLVDGKIGRILDLKYLKIKIHIRPNPEPRYKIPASTQGSISPISNLARGVLAPKSIAAINAKVTPDISFSNYPSCLF